MAKKKKSFFNKILSKKTLLLLQLLVTAIFLICMYILKILPSRYYIIVLVTLAIVFLVEVIFINAGIKKKRKTGKYRKVIVAKLTSLVTSILLVIASVYIVRGDSFFHTIGNAFQQTRVFNVYVLKDSKVEDITDLKNGTFGVEYKTDSKNMALATSNIEKKLNNTLKLEKEDSYMDMADKLYDKKVDCIVADQAYMSLLEANHEHFEAQTKSVYKIELTEDLKTVTTKTNVTENPFIIYVTGIDTYGKVSTVSRTDVNLLVCVNPKEKQILMVSIPRDTEVNLATSGKMDKLTHSAMYGINETIETIEGFLDLDINYYAKTNFSGIIDIIDALGGVTVDSPHEFTTLHGGYHIEKGINEMDGDKALCFVRERYDLPNGDFDRGRNQQILLKAMLSKMMSSKIITNYNSILSALEGCFETNMSSTEMKSLINMQLDDMADWEMFNVQVTGEAHKTDKTKSMYGQLVYTTEPDEDVVNGIIKVINKMEKAQKISDKDLDGLY